MTVLVSALGYFVDVFDLTVFSIVRIPSLEALGVPPDRMLATGARVLNLQQAGLLLGGLLWGVWGDRLGRVRVLFGSILLYSAATFASAFAGSVPVYGALRFLAGLGLSAELGIAVTLVGETMPASRRGWGTALVAGVGLLGAVAAAFTAARLSWRPAYMLGGALGLVLLVGRFAVRESAIFRAVAGRRALRRGDLRMLLHPPRARRFALCFLAGFPICSAIGILAYFAPEISGSTGTTGPVTAGWAVMFAYLGMSAGDLSCAWLAQAARSRRTAIAAFLVLLALASGALTMVRGLSPTAVYALYAALGFGSGYWIVLITQASELFGTNLRATVSTSIPNLIRGLNGPLALAFGWLAARLAPAGSALLVSAACIAVGALALLGLKETFGRNLDFVEK